MWTRLFSLRLGKKMLTEQGGKRRRGAILILLLLLLPGLLLLIGGAIDLSYLQLSRAEMRLAVDAATRAAADELARSESTEAATRKALEIARLNQVAGQPLLLRPTDLQFGAASPNSNGRWVFSAGGTPFNSVRITGVRAADRDGGGLPLFFSSIIGNSELDSQLASVASFRSVDIALVLDRSTSMKLDVQSFEQGMYTNDPRFCSAPRRSSRWIALDGAVAAFVSELNQTNAEERVALVTFGDDIPSYMCGRLPPATLDQTLTGDLTRISSRMTGWSRGVWNGNTNIAAGINSASDALTTGAGRRELSEKIMFVLTDGRATNSLTLSAARNAASRGIKISTITFSVDADQVQMREVARIGSGVQLHANSTTELVRVFRELAAQSAIVTD